MNEASPLRTAAVALVEQLRINGVEHVFCVPGESFLPVLDALRDSGITVTVCRHEGAAAMMAEAVGKTTGRPGICFVTRAPGATNASAGIYIAQQDSSPMIMFVGQVETTVREREAFQELDYRAVFGSMTKWTVEVDDPNRITEFVSRAFYTACSGRPGPVVIALPKDMLSKRVDICECAAVRSGRDFAGRGGNGKARRASGRSQKIRYSCLAAVAGPRLRAAKFTSSPSARGCRSRPAIGGRRYSTHCIHCTRVISGWVPTQSLWHAPRLLICWYSLAAVSAKSPRKVTRSFRARCRKQSLSTSIPVRKRSAGFIGRISPSMLRRTALSLR